MSSRAPDEPSQRLAALAKHASHDERHLMGVVAGWLMLAASVVTAVGLVLPGADRAHAGVVLGFSALIAAYGIVCALGLIDWERLSLSGHACVSAALVAVVGPIALWATGGAHSYAQALLVLPILYAAYFFPRRWAWPLTTEIVLVSASPLLYDERAVHGGFLPRLLVAGVAYLVLTLAIVTLKARMVRAEERQREMAVSDPLTGLGNRRAAQIALNAETTRVGRPHLGRRAGDESAGYAVVLLDLDDFKVVNDRHGHPAGDDVLSALASRLRAAARPDNTVARIGGDEFVVIAPCAGPNGARRIADALHDAASQVFDPAGEPLHGTVAWALFPADGEDAQAVVRAADRRLYDAKRGDEHHTLPADASSAARALSGPA
jgi:diguanylate cyclase (GGDEF)-like protein